MKTTKFKPFNYTPASEVKKVLKDTADKLEKLEKERDKYKKLYKTERFSCDGVEKYNNFLEKENKLYKSRVEIVMYFAWACVFMTGLVLILSFK